MYPKVPGNCRPGEGEDLCEVRRVLEARTEGLEHRSPEDLRNRVQWLP